MSLPLSEDMAGMTRTAVLSDAMWARIESVLPPVKGPADASASGAGCGCDLPDGNGLPLVIAVTPGQANDSPAADAAG